MANLEIIIEANGRKAIDNLAQTTRSVSAIRNEIINLTNDATPLEDKQERLIALNREYVQALQRDIAVIETLKDGEKALAKEYAKVSEEMTRIRVGIGANSEAYKNLEKELEVVTQKQELLNKLERDKKEKAPVDPEIDSINRRAEAYEKLFGSMARLNTQRSQLESLYLARSENGASETALKRTEQELAKVIALQKQAREEEEKLSAQTKWDAQVKDIEKNNQYLRQYSTELNAVSKTLEAYTKLQREAFVNEDNDKLSQTSAKIAQLRTEYDTLIQKQQELDKQASFDNKLADIETNYQATMLYGTELEALKEKYRALTSMGKELFKQGEYERADTIARKAREVGAEIERIETAIEKPKKSKIKLLEITKNIIKFQLIMKPLTSLMSGFIRTISTSMKLAAEAEQIVSKLTTVFQDQAAAMSVATTAAQQYGTATSTMANSLSTIGDLLQAQGMGKYESLELAEQWAGFFSDIIAFKDINMSLDEFAQNFMSGAAGNLRNFRSFGSIVRESTVEAKLMEQGLAELEGEELELAKVITRATMALEQQQNALGATSREWNTALSVNRRLSEAWKTSLEGIGSSLNKWATPLKRELTEILEYFNNINKVSNLIASGEQKIGGFAPTEGNIKLIVDNLDKDAEANIARIGRSLALIGTAVATFLATGGAGFLAGATISLAGGGAIGSIADFFHNTGNKEVPQAQELVDLAFATGATMDEVARIARKSSKVYSQYREIFEANITLAKEEYDRQKDFVEGGQLLSKAIAKASDNLESLASATDSVNLALGRGNKSVSDYLANTIFADKNSAEYVLGIKGKGAVGNEEEAIKGLVSLYYTYDKSITSLTDTQKQLQENFNDAAKAFKAVYGIDYNSSLKSITKNAKGEVLTAAESEEARLLRNSIGEMNYQLIATTYQLENYTLAQTKTIAELSKLYKTEEQAKNNEAMQDFRTRGLDINKAVALAPVDNTIYTEANAWKEAQLEFLDNLIEEMTLSHLYTSDELIGFKTDKLDRIDIGYENRIKATKSEAEDSLYKQLNAWVKAVQPKKYEGKYAEIDQWLDESLSDLTEIFTDYFTSLGKEGSELQELVNMNLEKYIPQLIDECNARKDNIDALEKQTRLQELQEYRQGKIDAINPISGFMESFSMGSELSGTLGGIEMILLDLLAETKLVSELNSFASDYIVPMLDAILEPVRLVLPLLGEMVQTLQPILQPIFDIIYAAMPAIVSAIGVIAIILNTVSSFVKMLYQAITFQFDKIDDTYREMDQKNYEILESMHETLKAVEATENQVAQNTSKDDGYLKALLDTGLINEAQYYEKTGLLKAGLYSDSVGRYNQTNVGNLNITISGDFSGMSEDRLARIILERFNVELKSGSGF